MTKGFPPWGPFLLMAVLATACSGNGSQAGAPPPPPASESGPTEPGTERAFLMIPARSTAAYEAQEKWLRWPLPTKASAKTDDVEGEMVLVMGDRPRLASNHFQVNMTTLVSQTAETPLYERPAGLFLSQRDGLVRTLLATDRFQFAEFTATGIENLPQRYVEGQMVRVRVPGNLTIRGVTLPAAFDTEVTLQGTALRGRATARIRMTDFGVEPPRSAAGNGMDVEDEVGLVVQFTAEAAVRSRPPTSVDRNPKLDATLAAVVATLRDQGEAAALHEAGQRGLEVEGDRVRVIARRPGPGTAPAFRADIAAVGGQVEGESGASNLVLLPISAIDAATDSASVEYLRTPIREESGG